MEPPQHCQYSTVPYNIVAPPSCSGTGNQPSWYFTLQWSPDRTFSSAPAKILVMQITHCSQQCLACRQPRESDTPPRPPGWNPPNSSGKICPSSPSQSSCGRRTPVAPFLFPVPSPWQLCPVCHQTSVQPPEGPCSLLIIIN